MKTRLLTAAYLIGAATLSVFNYHQPFDARDEPGHPDYEADWLFAIVFAIVPFIVGLVAKRRLAASRA